MPRGATIAAAAAALTAPAAAINNGLGRLPQMGYNSWCVCTARRDGGACGRRVQT